MNKIIIYVLPVLIIASCAVQKTIYYGTQDIQVNRDHPVILRTICILPFNDIRKDVVGNEIYFGNSRESIYRKEVFCINSERHYKKLPIGSQMAFMLADHMNKRSTFKEVLVDKKEFADFIISCNVAKLTSKHHQPSQMRSAPVVGAVVGGAAGAAIGRSATSIKSKAWISIAVTEIKIYDKNMKLLADLDSFAKDYEEELNADLACWCSYDNMSEKLRDFNSELILLIENKIAELNNN